MIGRLLGRIHLESIIEQHRACHCAVSCKAGVDLNTVLRVKLMHLSNMQLIKHLHLLQNASFMIRERRCTNQRQGIFSHSKVHVGPPASEAFLNASAKLSLTCLVLQKLQTKLLNHCLF